MAEIFNFYVYDNRTIQFPKNNLLEPIMQEDKDVATWRFRIPKVLNNIDMSGWAWWFVYVNAKGQEYSELLTLTDDIDEPASYSTADYDIDYGISKFPGSFSFALEAISTEQGGEISGEWHTKTYKHKVDGTLQGNQAEYAETESDIISALMQEVRNKVNQLVGGATPLPVNLKSLMTDHDKVYLYTGSETGESTGYWYYYNGTQFVPGGLYGAGIQIDSTPTQGSTNAVSSGGVYEALAGKVNAETGKGLSTNDYSNAEKQAVTDATADLSAITTATAEDVGKALKAKTVTNGKVTEWEFGETGDTAEIDALNEQMEMLITRREVPQPEPISVVQVCDLTGASVASASLGYYWKNPKINLPWTGLYYFNPSGLNLKIVYGNMYDSAGNQLTCYRNGNVYSNGITTSDGNYLEFVDARTIKEYKANGTVQNTWTADGDIAYISGNSLRLCYFQDANLKAGMTFGGESATYIEYGDSSSDEQETEYEYTISDDVGDFAHEYTLENYTDEEPTENSTNMVTSGGIKSALGKQFEASCNLIDESKFDFTSTSYWELESGYYFPVTAGKKICTSVSKPRFYFYDSSKAAISNTSVVNPYSLVDIPSGAVWARMNINASGNTLAEIQGKIMVYESDADSNDDRRDYVPPTKIIGNLVEGDIYGTAKPLSLDIDILTAAQYKAVRALNHARNAFRIATFNIYLPRTQYHWNALKQELKDNAIDICAMQEVNNSVDNGRYVQNLLTLNTWQFRYGSQAVFNGVASDKATVSVYEIVSTELFTTSTGRTYTKTVINLPQYKRNARQFTLSVYSAHLNSQNVASRLTEASEILATVAQDTNDFIVICMDSNAFESEADAQGKRPTWEAFVTAGFTPIHYGEYITCTFDAYSIDQIFMGQNITCADYDIVNSNDYLVPISGQNLPISDHCMVYADLIFDFDALL